MPLKPAIAAPASRASAGVGRARQLHHQHRLGGETRRDRRARGRCRPWPCRRRRSRPAARPRRGSAGRPGAPAGRARPRRRRTRRSARPAPAIFDGSAATKSVCSGAVTTVSLRLRSAESDLAAFRGFGQNGGARPRSTEASMTRLDRYILRQLIAALGFFLLIFTGVVWLTQAVRLIDTVVASGQSARVFLEFSAPGAAAGLRHRAAARRHRRGAARAQPALHRQRARGDDGRRPRPGRRCCGRSRSSAACSPLAMPVVLMVLVPRTGAILAERTRAIRSDLANALIVERQFLHPITGLTLFIADAGGSGEMRGHLPQRPARPRAAGHLLGRARAAAARGDGGAAGHARGRGARRRHGGRAHRGALRRVRLRPQRPACARTASGCRGRRNIRCWQLLQPTPEMLAGALQPRRLRRPRATTS